MFMSLSLDASIGSDPRLRTLSSAAEGREDDDGEDGWFSW